MARPIVIASNRGPISFSEIDGALQSTRGAGGLVTGIGPLVRDSDAMWIAAAMTDGDRAAARSGLIEAEGFRVRTLDIPKDDFELAYNGIANETLWYLYHCLYELTRTPTIDAEWYEAWAAFRRYNSTFAEAIIDESPTGAVVLLQDHHLALCAPMIRNRRPDMSVVHFSHTPFAPPHSLTVLPELARTELLLGYRAAVSTGFHSMRWSDDFEACCRTNLGLRARSFISPLAPDPDEIRAIAKSPECQAEYERLEELVGDRLLLARADRIELSKNLVRGFWAYDELLTIRPDLRGRVVFTACFDPSREGVADYRRYRAEMELAIDEINARWETSDWTPILYTADNDYMRTIALLRRYDVLLVNPIRDGLNLVAKEGPLVNERDGVVLLSREAGAFDELAGLVLEVHPYDITQTAQTMSSALDMDPLPRAELAAERAEVIASRTPRHWLDDQLEAAEP